MEFEKSISVRDILEKKFSDYLVPNILDLELFIAQDGLLFFSITLKNSDSGNQKYTIRSGKDFKNKSLQDAVVWFENLSNEQTYFLLDLIFTDFPEG
jgi:hypothetical protein